jgi:hypothetical protein
MRALLLECTLSDYEVIEGEVIRWLELNETSATVPCSSGAAISDMIQDLKYYRDLYEKEGRKRGDDAKTE